MANKLVIFEITTRLVEEVEGGDPRIILEDSILPREVVLKAGPVEEFKARVGIQVLEHLLTAATQEENLEAQEALSGFVQLGTINN